MRGLSLVAASGGHSSSRCVGLSPSRPLLLRSTGCRRAGSVIVAHGPSCSSACGIFPDQGSNPCPLHWQAESQPLRHQGSPPTFYFNLHSVDRYFPSVFCALFSVLWQLPRITTTISESTLNCKSCSKWSFFSWMVYLSQIHLVQRIWQLVLLVKILDKTPKQS